MRSCLQSKVNDNSPPLYASNGISAIGSFCKDGICPCPTRGISIIMGSFAVFPKNQLLFLVCFICFLCLVCLPCVGKQKEVRHKSDGDERLPPPAFTPSTACGRSTRSARPRGLGGLEPCARCAEKSMAEIGNRKERLRDYASFPEDFEFTALKGRNRVAPFRLGCSASLSRPQGALGFDPPLNPLGTP